MSFYKFDEGELLIASLGVNNANYQLFPEQQNTYTYPIDGWYWFDTDQEAYTFFNYTPSVS